MNNYSPFYGDTYGSQNTSAYGYQMTPDVPEPTMMSPTPSLPPLYPSMMTPQFNPPSPFPNYNLSQQRYAEGGHIQPQGLSHLVELLRSMGQRQDSVLAHINPQEAEELKQKYGGDVNPVSGLPQFGKKPWKKLKKTAKKAAKYIAPVAGAIAGTAIGGPAGGAIGGALGGGLGSAASGKTNLKNMLTSAALGGVGGYFAGPALYEGGKGLFTQGLGGLGTGLNTGFNSSLAGLGLGGAPAFGSQLGPDGPINLVPPSLAKGTSSGEGFLNKALLGTALLGTLFRTEKNKFPKEYPERLPDVMRNMAFQPQWDTISQPRKISPYQRTIRQVNQAYRPGFDPQELYFNYPEEEPSYFKRGGYVEGGSPGQADDVDVMLPEGSYIIDANTVAQLGDGNSKAGALRLDQFFNKHHVKGIHINHGGLSQVGRLIKAKISEGEYRVEPHEVTALGDGDNKKGAAMIKKMVSNLRSHKGFKGFPPKAKSLTTYMQTRNVRS